jgi:hypothetical protein
MLVDASKHPVRKGYALMGAILLYSFAMYLRSMKENSETLSIKCTVA